MIQFVPQVMVALMTLGMGLAFVWADRRSPTSRALSTSLVLVGVAVLLNRIFLRVTPAGPQESGLFAIPETLAMVTALQWLLRIRRTQPAKALSVTVGDRVLRIGQAAALLYGVFSVLAPDMRARDFLFAASTPEGLLRPGFWLFATPVIASVLSGFASTVLLLNRHPDRPERIRLLGMACGAPFMVAGFILEPDLGAVSVVLGEMVFLVGAVQYHVLQGQRGLFMSRFLSTQVAALVHERGLKEAMRQNNLEITVVVTDIRGFTAYAEAHPSSRVIEVLREYYDAVGAVVADFGSTIKDYAGDGILILVGAPIPNPQHARCGMELARRLRDAATPVVKRWGTRDHALGLGLGVASGFVTVGVIGGASRLEYTAVGPAVNLASRLCEQAADGEILIAARTTELAGAEGLEPRSPLQIKGFAEPVSLYAMPVQSAV